MEPPVEPTGPDPEHPEPPEGPAEGRREDDPRTLEDWLRDAGKDSMLWPMFVVIGGVAVTLGAGILAFALYAGNLGGIAALVILVLMSADAIRQDVRARGFGLISRGIVGLWIGSAFAALGAYALGLLDLA